jgi:hypothetical protein
MLLLSGKRKFKSNINYQNTSYQNLNYQNTNYQNLNYQNPNYQNTNYQNTNYQKEYNMNTSESFYSNELSKTTVTKSTDKSDFSYQIKTKFTLLPEYEIYHLIFGQTKEYVDVFLNTIKDCLAKKMSYLEIKSIFK